MERLTVLDAGFLEAENSDESVSLAIGAVAVLDGPMPDRESLASTLAERIRRCPRLTQRPRGRRFDLGAPEWVDDDDFDLARHIRRVGVPAPGGERELFELAAEVMSRRLDRSRPLWEVWVIDGLRDNRWAMLMKVHHCIADGIAATQMLTALSDDGIADSSAGNGRAAQAPVFAGELWPVVNPANWPGLLRGAVNTVRGGTAMAAGLLRSTSSPLNGPLTSLRRYSAARVALADVKQVCRAYDVTVNDVALAALAESYRAMLLRRGQQPAPDSLPTLVPVSTRADDALDATDNRVSAMLPCLPVDEDNPIRRLQLVSSRMARTKATGQGQAGNLAISAANLAPFALTSWAVRLLMRLPQRGVAVLATNVPGPRQPLQLMGRRVIQVLPVPPLAMQLRTGAAILSYADELTIGIMADFDAVPDVDELACGIETAVARLVAKSKRRRPARDHRGLSVADSAG